MEQLTATIKVDFTDTVRNICALHPTCEGCCFMEKHKGCYFRGKTPREWIDFEGMMLNAPSNV